MLEDWFTAEKGSGRVEGTKCRLMPIKVSFFCVFLHPSSGRCGAYACVCVLSGRTQVKMAEGSRDQGSVGTTDPEEDSPNMIVYRKVRLTVRAPYVGNKSEEMTRRRAADSSLVCVAASPRSWNKLKYFYVS